MRFEERLNLNQVRQAVVQTANGLLERPAVKIAILDIEPRERTDKTDVEPKD